MNDSTSSRAVAVTFFEDRACVKRRAKVSVTEGLTELSVSGISVIVDDATLVARVLGAEDARVMTARVRRFMHTVPAASGEEIERLVERHNEASQELEFARRAAGRIQAERQRVERLEQALLESMGTVPAGPKSDAERWRQALSAVNDQLETSDDAAAEAARRVAEARRKESRAKLLLEEARAEHPEMEARVELQLSATATVELEVELEYYVPCALWRPSHVARLSAKRDEVELTTLATVWQRTGETWEEIDCRFSTARPTRAAEAPLLVDDVLYARPKTDLERHVVQVEARDVDIASTGSVRAGVASEMPGVDDGGEPLTMTASAPVTIPSTGEPFRVEVGRRVVPCQTGIVAYPERATVPYLRAVGTWSGELPILAGPVVVMRGNDYAGRARVEFVPPGERFELSFGVESGLSLHRTVEDEHTTTTVTAKNILNRSIKVFVSNLSSQRRTLTVIERVPVSEIEEVTIKKVESGVRPDEDGFVELALELPPRGVETLSLGYRVEYGSKVVLSW